jgi:hypothetical protein
MKKAKAKMQNTHAHVCLPYALPMLLEGPTRNWQGKLSIWGLMRERISHTVLLTYTCLIYYTQINKYSFCKKGIIKKSFGGQVCSSVVEHFPRPWV